MPTKRIQEMLLPPLKNKISLIEEVETMRTLLSTNLVNNKNIKSSLKISTKTSLGTNLETVSTQVNTDSQASRIVTNHR